MTDSERLKEWEYSVNLLRRNAEGLGLEIKVYKDETGKIHIKHNTPEQYRSPISKLIKFISDFQWVINILTEPYCFSLPGFEDELIDYYPTLLDSIFNEGYEPFVVKLWKIENVLRFKHSMPDIKMINGEWVIDVRTKEGIKTYFRRKGQFEDENGDVFFTGSGVSQLFWDMFDDKAEYSIPVLNLKSLVNPESPVLNNENVA